SRKEMLFVPHVVEINRFSRCFKSEGSPAIQPGEFPSEATGIVHQVGLNGRGLKTSNAFFSVLPGSHGYSDLATRGRAGRPPSPGPGRAGAIPNLDIFQRVS